MKIDTYVVIYARKKCFFVSVKPINNDNNGNNNNNDKNNSDGSTFQYTSQKIFDLQGEFAHFPSV